MLDRETHQRYLDYRERFVYFGKNTRILTMDEYAAAEQEHAVLSEKGDSRDDEEEARFDELSHILLCD